MRSEPTPTQTTKSADRVPWTILALLSIAQFMVILDITVVNVALPSIGADLGFAAGDLQWVVTAYVLFTGGLLLLGGRMSDLFGRRPVFLSGLTLFTAASLASGLAATPEALIVSRAAQGLGAAMLSPAALSIITTTYEGAQRTRALSIWGALGAGGAAAGVLFGGMLTTWLSWEWVFFINVPVGLVTAALALRVVPPSPGSARSWRDLDLSGALALVSALFMFVYAIEDAGDSGWASVQTLGLLALSAALLAGFAAIERAAVRPLVTPSTWRIRSLVSSATVMLGATGLMVGAFFINSMFLQGVIGASALEAGLAFLPLVLVIGLAAQAGQQLLGRIGGRGVVVGGLGLIGVGYALLADASVNASYVADLLPGFLLIGFGIGLVFVAVSVTGMADVDTERSGLASGLMTTGHELGAALGVAVFSAIALGSGAEVASGAGIAAGYGDAAIAGAVIAGALALLAAVAVPALRTARASEAPAR
jgi:EmrB/QacA subfamily drug resistance transporter